MENPDISLKINRIPAHLLARCSSTLSLSPVSSSESLRDRSGGGGRMAFMWEKQFHSPASSVPVHVHPVTTCLITESCTSCKFSNFADKYYSIETYHLQASHHASGLVTKKKGGKREEGEFAPKPDVFISTLSSL